MRALVKSEDYRLARTFIADPAANIRRWSESLNENVATLAGKPRSPAAVKDAYIRIYADYVNEVLQVLAGVGEEREAQNLKTFAIESIDRLTFVRRCRSRYPKRARSKPAAQLGARADYG